jgi:hypothetical protein
LAEVNLEQNVSLIFNENIFHFLGVFLISRQTHVREPKG